MEYPPLAKLVAWLFPFLEARDKGRNMATTVKAYTAKHTGLLTVKTECTQSETLWVDGVEVGVVPEGVNVVSVVGVPVGRAVEIKTGSALVSHTLPAKDKGRLWISDLTGRGVWVAHRDRGDVTQVKPGHAVHNLPGGTVVEKTQVLPGETLTLHVATLTEENTNRFEHLLRFGVVFYAVTGGKIAGVPENRSFHVIEFETSRVFPFGGREYRLTVQTLAKPMRLVPTVTYLEATEAGLDYNAGSYLNLCREIAGVL